MKTLTLRLTDQDHAALNAAASAERMPMSSYLMRLFDKHVEAEAPRASTHSAPKANKRDQAFEEYRALMDDLPTQWNQEAYDFTYTRIMQMRNDGGNIPHTEMPLPRSMVNWKNSFTGLDTRFATWSAQELREELQRGYNVSANHFLTIRDQEAELGRLLGREE